METEGTIMERHHPRGAGGDLNEEQRALLGQAIQAHERAHEQRRNGEYLPAHSTKIRAWRHERDLLRAIATTVETKVIRAMRMRWDHATCSEETAYRRILGQELMSRGVSPWR